MFRRALPLGAAAAAASTALWARAQADSEVMDGNWPVNSPQGEGARIAAAVQEQGTLLRARYDAELGEMHKHHQEHLRDALSAQRRRLVKELDAVLSEGKEQAKHESKDELAAVETKAGEAHEGKEAALRAQMSSETAQIVASEMDILRARLAAETGEGEAAVARAAQEVDDVANKRKYEAELHVRCAAVHKLASKVLQLEQAVLSKGKFDAELADLRHACGSDDVVATIIHTVPRDSAARGVPSKREIDTLFRTAYDEVYAAALVKPGNDTLGGRVMSKAMSLIIAPPGSGAIGDSPEAILARADAALEDARLEVAVTEMEKLQGLHKEMADDWLAVARKRLVAEQAVTNLRAYVTSLARELE